MYQAAEGKVYPERKKVKTAVHAIFELLNRLKHRLKESDQFQVLLTAIFLRNSQKNQRTVLTHRGKN